jgi:hypothetical protein
MMAELIWKEREWLKKNLIENRYNITKKETLRNKCRQSNRKMFN